MLLSCTADRNSDGCRTQTPHRRGEAKRRSRVSQRIGTLLVTVQGLSGATYEIGTKVVVRGRGSSVDAFVHGDWLPLAWWEFAEDIPEALPTD
jgi:hypothetical protein